MNYLLTVCIIGLALTENAVPYAFAQTPAMRQGVTVQMVVTSNATPMPAADNNDAWIVTITADGNLYFGTDPVDADGLKNEMTAHPRRRDAKLYTKADARAPFGAVEKVLEIGRTVYFESAVLLTSQNETSALGKLVAPKGLEVFLTSAPSDTVLVELHNSAQPRPSLKVNHQEIAPFNLQKTLNQSLQNRDDRVIEIRAEGSLPFAQVAQAIDACTSVKARVVVTTE